MAVTTKSAVFGHAMLCSLVKIGYFEEHAPPTSWSKSKPSKQEASRALHLLLV
jgi:hypothetical protein